MLRKIYFCEKNFLRCQEEVKRFQRILRCLKKVDKHLHLELPVERDGGVNEGGYKIDSFVLIGYDVRG
jgi:hypothetical protein